VTTCYIAGPMRGIENYNFRAFDEATRIIRSALGWTVLSPADHDRETGMVTEINGVIETTPAFSIEKVMRWDLAAVAESSFIILLPGWETSTGAAQELQVARWCGVQPLLFTPATVGKEWSLVPLEEPVPATVIGLMGYAQAGKDTVALELVKAHDFTRIAFADVLRAMAYALNPMVIDRHYRLQDAVDEHGWDYSKTRWPEVRQLLQRLGTEAGRNILGENIWVDTALKLVIPGGKYVFSDVRFPNEVAAVRSLGGKLWRVTRPGTAPVNGHASEIALDHVTPDLIVQNSGSLTGLADRVGVFVANV